MGQELSTIRQLIVQKNIKHEFYIYKAVNKFGDERYDPSESILRSLIKGRKYFPKFSYFFNFQNKKIAEVNQQKRRYELKLKIKDKRFLDDLRWQMRLLLKYSPRKYKTTKRFRNKSDEWFIAQPIDKIEDLLLCVNRDIKYIELSFKDVFYKLKWLEIPKRLLYKEEVLFGDNDNKLIRVIIPEPLISFLEQKYPQEQYTQQIVILFKELCAQDKGLGFEEYISQWAKELIEEMNLKSFDNKVSIND